MTTHHNHVRHTHSDSLQHHSSSQIIVPTIMQIICPESVIEIGCGSGVFLHYFKKLGVKKIFGLDKSPINQELLCQYISENEFAECDLAQPIVLTERFDLAICLEVGEHLPSDTAKTLVHSLIACANVVLFSSAIPHQDNAKQNPNEQWLSYWQHLFAERDYVLHDILRPLFWHNPDILTWLRQNMVIFAHKDRPILTNAPANPIVDIVHPDQYLSKIRRYEKALNMASRGVKHYLTRPFTAVGRREKR